MPPFYDKAFHEHGLRGGVLVPLNEIPADTTSHTFLQERYARQQREAS